MKTVLRYLVISMALAMEAFFITGCANTAHGVSADYHNAEDKVENATH